MQQDTNEDTPPTDVDSVEDGTQDIHPGESDKASKTSAVHEYAWKALRIEIERRHKKHWTRNELRNLMLKCLEIGLEVS